MSLDTTVWFLLMVFWLIMAIIVYADAKEQGMIPIVWGGLVFLTGVIGLVGYLIARSLSR